MPKLSKTCLEARPYGENLGLAITILFENLSRSIFSNLSSLLTLVLEKITRLPIA